MRGLSKAFKTQISSLAAAMAVSLSVALSSAGAWAQPIPAEAFGRRPAVFGAALSPDGGRIALAESNPAGLTWVSVINLANPRERSTYGPPENTQLRQVEWIDDNFVAFLVNRTYGLNQLPVPPGVRYVGGGRAAWTSFAGA